ncbi:MAG: hypothetical protein AAFQ67_01790 [Pseudomonadota bacterium]
MKYTLGSSVVIAALLLSACGSKDTETTNDDAPAGSSSSVDSQVQETVEDSIAAFVPTAKQFGVEQFKLVSALGGQRTGVQTLWVEDYGDRVGILVDAKFGQLDDYYMGYWDGEKIHFRGARDGLVQHVAIRPITTEPSAFATTPPNDLQTVGYALQGEKTILGMTCEHWINANFGWEGCRKDHMDLEWNVGINQTTPTQTTIATEYVEGEGIPAEIKALASVD